jgi:hypothetical protein
MPRRKVLLPLGLLFLSTTSLWAADRNQGALPRAMVSELHGDALLVPTDEPPDGRPLRFHESVAIGDEVTVREGGVLELLLRRETIFPQQASMHLPQHVPCNKSRHGT